MVSRARFKTKTVLRWCKARLSRFLQPVFILSLFEFNPHLEQMVLGKKKLGLRVSGTCSLVKQLECLNISRCHSFASLDLLSFTHKRVEIDIRGGSLFCEHE